MNINDLDDYEVESTPTETVESPLNIADLQEDYEVETQPEDRTMSPVTAQATGVGVGVGVDVARRGLEAGGQKLLEGMGKLKPDQIKTLTADPEAYKKARNFEKLLEDFTSLGQKTRELGFSSAKEAKESLKALPNIPTKGVVGAMSSIQSAPFVDIPESELPKPLPRTSNITQLEKLGARKVQLQDEIRRRIESGVESVDFNKELDILNSQLKQTEDGIQKATTGALDDLRNPVKPTLSDYENVTGIPEQILEANPNLKNKRIQKEMGAALKSEVDFLKSGTVSPYDLGQKYIQNLQDKASYGGIPDETTKFRQEMARNVQEHLKEFEGTEEYSRKQGLSKKAIESEEKLAQFGLGLDAEDRVIMKSPNKIKEIYKKGNASEISRLEKIIEEAQNIGFNPMSNIDTEQMKQIDRFQSEFPLAAIKNTVEATPENWMGRVVKGTVGGMVAGPGGAAVAATALPTMTKIQETAALAKGSDLFKGASKVAKFAGPLAGLATAALSYKDARRQGLDPLESSAVTVGEVVNPIPLTDVTGAYIAGKQEFKKNPWDEALAPAAKAASTAFVKPMVTAYEEGKKGTQAVSKANINDYKQQFRTPDYKFQSTDSGNMQNLSDRLAEFRDNKAAQGWSQELTEASQQSDSQKEATLHRLNQLKEFRALVRKTKGIKE
jgi:hypothetical protein